MRWNVGSVTAVVLLCIALTACDSPAGVPTAVVKPKATSTPAVAAVGGSTSGTPLPSQVIELDAATVVGGPPIEGALVISNAGDGISLSTAGCMPDFVVVLTNREYSPDVVWATDCAVGRSVSRHGTTRLPFTLETTYLSCQPGGYGPGVRPCTATGQAPPLPAGVYQAVVEWEGPAPLPPAQPVAVTVLDKASWRQLSLA
jgi:hypothetical protein